MLTSLLVGRQTEEVYNQPFNGPKLAMIVSDVLSLDTESVSDAIYYLKFLGNAAFVGVGPCPVSGKLAVFWSSDWKLIALYQKHIAVSTVAQEQEARAFNFTDIKKARI